MCLQGELVAGDKKVMGLDHICLPFLRFELYTKDINDLPSKNENKNLYLKTNLCKQKRHTGGPG